MSQDQNSISRRKFLSGAGTALAGTTAAFIGHGLFFAPQSSAAVNEEFEWPWPYVKLDPEKVRIKGHDGYYDGDCSQGALYAIVSELQEKIGKPYTCLPVQIMGFGGGGVAGWCTLCGALNGACAAISLTSEDFYKLSSELVAWYCETPFPSEKSNELAKNKAFKINKSTKVLEQTVSKSPLCHVSVCKWCKENGCGSGCSDRSERCARMVGDVAAKTVEILNAYHSGSFQAQYSESDLAHSCRACHSKDKSYEVGGWSRGKMDCSGCHIKGESSMVDPHHPDN
ncbi:MAG: C-GCAxxG-C-C family protein [Desulfonatronovibrionaceae bacterium]